MKNKRFIPLIAPLIVLLLGEASLIYPKLFFVSIALSLATLFFATMLLGKDNEEKYWPFFSALAIIIFLSISSYTALISSALIIQILLFSIFVLNFYYFRTLYYYLVKKEYNRNEQLSSFIVFSGFVSVFAAYSTVYLLPFFISVNPGLLVLAPLVFVLFLFLQGAYFNRQASKNNFSIFLVTTLVLAQISWIVSYLPLNPQVLGFVIALVYYFLSLSARLSIKGKLSRKSLKWPLILVSSSVLILFLTARWL